MFSRPAIGLSMMSLLALSAGAGVSLAAVTERASVTSLESQSSEASANAHVSGDGRWVAFVSSGVLVAGDAGVDADIFVRDRLNGTTARISLPDPATGNAEPNGSCGLAHAGARVISDDGRFVVFHSSANNLVAGDTNGLDDVFVRDRDLDGNGVFDEPGAGKTRTTRVSLTSGEAQAIDNCPGGTCVNHSLNGTISGDGRYVAFSSDFNFAGGSIPFQNVYRRDRDVDADGIFDEPASADTELVSVPVNCVGCAQDGFSGSPAISGDGRHVAFVSRSTHIVFSDNNNSDDIFVRDMEQGVTTRVSVDSSEGEGQSNRDCTWPSISYFGRWVAFASPMNDLVTGDTNNFTDIFVRDRDADNDAIFDEAPSSMTERVSLGYRQFPLPGGPSQLNDSSIEPCISDDGGYVAFTTFSSDYSCGLLGCDDTNSQRDVMIRDRTFGVTHRVSMSAADAEIMTGPSSAPSVSRFGRFVSFSSTATDVVSPDANGTDSDVFVRAGVFAPLNDECSGVYLLQNPAEIVGDTFGATDDGDSTCGSSSTSPDAWFSYKVGCAGTLTIDTLGSSYDTVLSVHSACPGTLANQIACDDDSAGGNSALVTVPVAAGQTVFVRVAGFNGAFGYYQANFGYTETCPGDADGSAPVGLGDLAVIIQHWNTNVFGCENGDLTGNGFVGLEDIAKVITNWANTCP